MKKNLYLSIGIASLLIGGSMYLSSGNFDIYSDQALASKFNYLKKNGNSACSGAFKDSIASMADSDRIMGSCCSPMNLHRYTEQVEGLKKYEYIKKNTI